MSRLTDALQKDQTLSKLYDVNLDPKTDERSHFTWQETNNYLMSAGSLQDQSTKLNTLFSLRNEKASDGIRLFDSRATVYLDRIGCAKGTSCSDPNSVYYQVSNWASKRVPEMGWSITPPNANGEVKLTGPAKFGEKGKYVFRDLAAFTVFGYDFPSEWGINSDNLIGIQEVGNQGKVSIYFIDLQNNQIYTYDGQQLNSFNVDAPTTVTPVAGTQDRANNGSEAGSPHTIVAALGATEEFLGNNRVWRSTKPQAQAFFRDFKTLRSQVEGVDFVETEAGLGRSGMAQVNRFLKDHHFDIQLDPSNVQPSDVSAAAVMDIKVTWREKGEARDHRLSTGSQKEVPGVWMSSINTASSANGHNYPIIQVPTQNGFDVYMTRYDDALSNDPMALSQVTASLMNGIGNEEAVKGAWFPMVDFEKMGDLSWLLGATTTDAHDGITVTITQALAQYRLRMNEVGARAEAAVAVSGSKGLSFSGPNPVYIDGPFLVWFVKDGVTYFSAYIDEESMKKPRGLD